MQKLRQMNQQGIVSIVVSVIIMIILTLIAIAFAQIMRREQRQALDRQLSSQAYYAAESAINDAAFTLSQDPERLGNNQGRCETSTNGPLSENVISDELNIEYSCVTIDSTPTELRYDSIRVDESIQVELRPVDDTGALRRLEDLTITWRDIDGDGRARVGASLLDLPQVAAWGDQPGLIRIEIVPITNVIGRDTRDNLVGARKVLWLYPTNGSVGVTTWNATVSGEIIRGACSAGLDTTCEVTIQDMPTNGGTDSNMYYIVRLKSVYDDVEATINGSLVGGGQAYFRGAQTQIDATGRAGDVLRRISARVAIERVYPIPEFGLQGFGGVCKRLELVSSSNVSYNCN